MQPLVGLFFHYYCQIKSRRSGIKMSWEYVRYEAKCEFCGRMGVCVRGDDDWGRTSTTWEGFNSRPPSATAVGRMRSDSRDMVPHCPCGEGRIVVGKRL